MKIRGCFPLRWIGIQGIVLYPFIFYAPKNPDLVLEHHEYIHWQQIKIYGVYQFYFRYLKEYWQGRKRGLNHDQAYRDISFEKEAYQEQHNPGHLVRRTVA